MIVKKIVICLIVLCSSIGFSQKDTLTKPKSILSLSLISSTYSYAPRWNVGYMKKLSERYWIGLDVGYGNHAISISESKNSELITTNYQLFELRPEVYYDLRPKSKLKHLLSMEVFYINHKDTYTNSWYHDMDNSTYYEFDKADYKRVKYGSNINYSLVYYLAKKVAFIQKTGFGFRTRNVAYTNIINKTVLEYFEDDNGYIVPTNNGYRKDDGTATGFNFNFDFKFVYMF